MVELTLLLLGKNMIFEGIEKYIANSQQTKGRSFHLPMTYFWIQIVHYAITTIVVASERPSLSKGSDDAEVSDSIPINDGLQPHCSLERYSLLVGRLNQQISSSSWRPIHILWTETCGRITTQLKY